MPNATQYGSADELFHNRLQFHEVYATWVIKLIEQHNLKHVIIHALKYASILHAASISPRLFTMFVPFKNALRDGLFTTDKQVKEEMPTWLAAKPKTIFPRDIRMFVERRITMLKVLLHSSY